MEEMTITIIGRSGAGKGTQVKLLKDYISENYPNSPFYHFESGNEFRKFIKDDGYTNDIMRDIINEGGLGPNFITDWLFVNSMVENFVKGQSLILDGFPRTLHQANTLDSALDFYEIDKNYVVHIDVSEDEVKRRMEERGRSDDRSPEVIEKRMQWYNKNVIPTLNKLRTDDRYEVIDINGEQAIDDIHQEIIDRLHI